MYYKFKEVLSQRPFSQAATFQGYFPKWQLPKCSISQAATVHIREVATWEIVAWEVALGKLSLGKYQAKHNKGSVNGFLRILHAKIATSDLHYVPLKPKLWKILWFFLARKVFNSDNFCIISVSTKFASNFCRETTKEINSLNKQKNGGYSSSCLIRHSVA